VSDVSELISMVIPLVPPSVNHYKNKNRKTGRWYVTAEWTSFQSAVRLFARGRSISGNPRTLKYHVDLVIYLGKRKRGDGDNFVKAVFDGLQAAGVIHSDAAIKTHTVQIERDWHYPRTEITVRASVPRKLAA
jgi:Holliday junction resolvase RusA-like endonuclease